VIGCLAAWQAAGLPSALQLAHDLGDLQLHWDEMGSRAQKCFTIGRVDARKCGLSRVCAGKRMCLTVRAKSPKGAIVLNLRGVDGWPEAGRTHAPPVALPRPVVALPSALAFAATGAAGGGG
jgi:hypothetical protein